MIEFIEPTRNSLVTRVLMNEHPFGIIMPNGEFFYMVDPLPEGRESILSSTRAEIASDWREINAERKRVREHLPMIRLVKRVA